MILYIALGSEDDDVSYKLLRVTVLTKGVWYWKIVLFFYYF